MFFYFFNLATMLHLCQSKCSNAASLTSERLQLLPARIEISIPKAMVLTGAYCHAMQCKPKVS
jgi:hypothetical protein